MGGRSKKYNSVIIITYLEKRELLLSEDHPFLTNSFASEVNISQAPIYTILNQIRQARAEMQLVQQLLRDIHAPADAKPIFNQTLHVIPQEEQGEDLACTQKTRITNLESTYILFDYASKQFKEGVQSLRQRVLL